MSQRSTEWNWKLATTAGDGNVIVLTAIATFLLGDVNQDGFINLIDIQPFVALISGGGFQLDADITPDSVVNLLVAASSGWLTNPRS